MIGMEALSLYNGLSRKALGMASILISEACNPC